MAGRKKEKPTDVAYTLKDLEQVRVLSHPLRVRILESLFTERTTKQVAELLGEKPTRLYHHVAALERVGLVRLIRTRRNRGAVEKYYRAVARAFNADPTLFETADRTGAGKGAMATLVDRFFDRTAREVSALIRSDVADSVEEVGIISFLEIHASEGEMARLRTKLLKIIKDLEKDPDKDPGSKARKFRMTLAFFPLDLEGK